MDAFARNHPILFVLAATIAWLALLLVFMGIASSALRKPYGDATSGTIARLVLTACVLALLWRLGWLKGSGVSILGRWQVWLLALGGLIYSTGASLYSFYGSLVFDFSGLARMPEARAVLTTQLMVALAEETLFRGLALYALTRLWGNTTLGLVGSVLLTSLIFAGVHITQVFSHGAAPAATLLLILETWVVSIWWGALVLAGGSIWPAVLLHFAANAVVPLQGLIAPMNQPEILAYKRLLGFNVVLGLLGIGLLVTGSLGPLATHSLRKRG